MTKANLVVFENPEPFRPTLDSLLTVLEDQRVRAVADGAYAAANQSVALQAKLLGLITHKVEVNQLGSYSESRSVEEIIQAFALEYGESEAKELVRIQRKITRSR